MPEVASQTLDIVGRELGATLASARVALESYEQQPEEPALLGTCRENLHQAYGVLRLLEIYGASLLAEEMEQVTLYLMTAAADKKPLAEGLEVLMRAMMQLPAYLERVMAGGRDLALVLLPLANDLRAVRGAELLSEGTLLLLNLKSDAQPHPRAPAGDEPVLTVEQWARKLRTRFQAALVGWLTKNGRPEGHLDSLAAVADKLERIATRQPVFQLWWVFGALIESLQDNGLQDHGEAAVKRLLSLGDREIRRLYELGEARYAQSPPVDLLNSLLYYVGQSTSSGPRVSQVRESFRLNELLPVDDGIEQVRSTLSAPSMNLMHTVAGAIREDLSKVKDVLDIYVRRGTGQPKELASQVDTLRKMGDTLAVLGLGDLRSRVQAETDRLEKIVAGRLRASESVLLDIASTLISVEDALDEQLVGKVMPEAADGDGEGEDKEFQQVKAAVLKECILNLARIKELVAQSVAGTLERDGLDTWPELMKGLRAGLLMLGKTRAVEILAAITVQLKRVLQPGARPSPGVFIDRLADAIVSVEYYMETVQAGRSDPWYMLDNAQACVQSLARESTINPPLPPLDPSSFVRTQSLNGGAKPGTEIGDPEVLKLFIEEAKEEVSRIERYFPAWDQDPAQRESLVVVRRTFHTLKGSGRMVGARDLSEFAWAIENLLNRLLDSTLERSPAVVEVLREAVRILPGLIAQLETGRPPTADAAGIAGRAHTLAGGKAPERAAGPVPEEAPARDTRRPRVSAPTVPPAEVKQSAESVLPPRAPPGASTFDTTLRQIYSTETSAHVATVRAYLAREGKLPEPHFLPEDVYRACHTLSGSSRMAQARHNIRLADPLDHWLNRVFKSGAGLRNQDLAVLADCMAAMESVVSHLDEPTGYFVNHARLAQRIVEADKALDQRINAQTPFTAPSAARGPAPPVEPPPHRSPFDEIDLSELDPPKPPEDPSLSPEVQDQILSGGMDPSEEESEAGMEFDPEVAAIFGEEAVDLLEASQEALMGWRSEPDNADYRTALERPLHTLKGGARMAGLSRMGNLSHELESLVKQIAGGGLAADERVFDVLQASLDELQRMREHIMEGDTYPSAQSMILRIRSLSRAGAPPSQSASTISRTRAPAVPLAEPSRDLPRQTSVREPVRAPASPSTRPQSRPAPVEEPPAARAPPPAPARTPAAAPSRGGRVTMPPPVDPLAGFDQVPTFTDAPPLDTGEPAGGGWRTPAPKPPAEKPRPETARAPEARTVETPRAPARQPEPAKAPEPRRPAPARLAVDAEATQVAAATGVSTGVSTKVRATERGEEGLVPPQPVPPGREPAGPVERQEMARIDAGLLDTLLNTSGEASIARSRLEQQMGTIDTNIGELSRTVIRLKEQLRVLDLEIESQIKSRHVEETDVGRSDFDPLELDRYSTIQQYSRALAETASDVGSVQQQLETLGKDTMNLLQQQARHMAELQNGLMRTRMVSFGRHVQRLMRIVRQAAADTGKRAELVVEGAEGELDRQVLDRMLPPFEHMLRNSVVHGIEKPDERLRRGKSETGRILLEIHREGAEVMVRISDDGTGMNLKAIREKGLALGLISAGQEISDEDAMQLILEPGFSTAGAVTQQAGRGVGMDVVSTEIKRLGGALHMETKAGEGSIFTIRLPFTLAISTALVVRTGDEFYALPLPTVEGVLRLSKKEVTAHLGRDAPAFDYGGQKYRFQPLANFVGLEPSPLPDTDVTIPVVLVRAGEHSSGLVADELVGSREIVVKSVGPQISGIRGISGATILGDGRIVIILDIGALVRAEWRHRPQLPLVPREKVDTRAVAMVVDDSITVRRVTQRLLERNGYRVIIARDGMEAVAQLQDNVPDVILLDIEMPRMDGYEVAAQVRANPRTQAVPIIMITSRVGEKHRSRAVDLGVDDYLGKPYQEQQLLKAIRPLVARHRGVDMGSETPEPEIV